jgi:hypothetical protein
MAIYTISGTIYSVGPSRLSGDKQQFNTISIRKADGSIASYRNVSAYDTIIPEITPGNDGTFHFWKSYLIAIRLADGTLIESISSTVMSYRIAQAFRSLLLSLFGVGIPFFLYFVFLGPRSSKVRAEIGAENQRA